MFGPATALRPPRPRFQPLMHPALAAAALAALCAAAPAAAAPPPEMAGMLEAHNRARQAVGVPPLQWSPQLAATAQAWADHLRGEHCAMRHSRTSGLGENLAWSPGRHMSPAAVVSLWVDEARAYHHASNSCAPGAVCGHYTQVVWRKTRLLGCGVAACGNAEIWVCNYTPPGNVNGDPPY